jgi:hypothetical protein
MAMPPESSKAEDILVPRQIEEIWDHERGLIIKETQDVENLLDENHADRTSGNNGYSKSRVWRRIGSIPLIFIEQVMRERGINLLDGSPDAQKELRRLLHEHPRFKTVDRI